MNNSRISLCRSILGVAALLAVGIVHPAAAEIGVEVNGRPVAFTSVAPQRVGGRVLIPLRAVVEALGAEVKWNAATQTVTGRKGEREFSLPIGARTASVNGMSVDLDVPAQMLSGTTMVPLRFVAEALGAEVEWNAAAQQVVIGGGGGEAPEPPVAEEGRIRGEVVSVQPGANATITLRANGVRQTFRITRNTIILRGPEGRKGSTVDLDEVRPGDTVRLRVNAERGVAEVVEAYVPAGRGGNDPRDSGNTEPRGPRDRGPRDPNTVYGEVISIRPRGNRTTVTVQTRSGRESFDVPRDAEITRAIGRQAARPAEIADVEVGDRVRVVPDASGVVTRLEARASDATAPNAPAPVANRNLTGEIVSIRANGNPATLTLLVGTRRVTLDVMADTDIFRAATRGGKASRASLSQLQVGDQVRVRTDPRGTVAEVIDVEGQ
jgi:hypothetical protein